MHLYRAPYGQLELHVANYWSWTHNYSYAQNNTKSRVFYYCMCSLCQCPRLVTGCMAACERLMAWITASNAIYVPIRLYKWPLRRMGFQFVITCSKWQINLFYD